MLWRRAVIAVIAVGMIGACYAPAAAPVRGPHAVDPLPVASTPRSQASICFSGRSWGKNPYASGGNSDLRALCEKLPNLIRDVGGPDAPYPFFRWNSDIDHALDVVVRALDTDRDGGVTNADEAVDLNVVGFSWGGFNARDLIEQIGIDRRFSPTRRRVARFFALDPYRTDALIFARKTLDVPANVDEVWDFRHTVAPARDCSRSWGDIVGPFTGRPPRCSGNTACNDIDFSLWRSAKDADHCAIPAYATVPILRIVSGLPTRLD